MDRCNRPNAVDVGLREDYTSAGEKMTIRSTLKLLSLVGAVALLAGCFGTTAPIAILTGPVVSGAAPLEVLFDLSQSFHPNGDPISFTLDFGDGSDPETGTDFGIILRHTYASSGTYLAELVVSDAHGNSSSDGLVITASGEGPPVGTGLGSTAPDFTGHTYEGDEVSLYDYRGQVVLLEFWGAWCGPCKTSMPHLDDLTTTYATQGLVTITVSTDLDKQDSIDFLDSRGFDAFVNLWEPGGKNGNPIDLQYNVTFYPTTYVLDRQGVIRFIGHPNYLTGEYLESLL